MARLLHVSFTGSEWATHNNKEAYLTNPGMSKPELNLRMTYTKQVTSLCLIWKLNMILKFIQVSVKWDNNLSLTGHNSCFIHVHKIKLKPVRLIMASRLIILCKLKQRKTGCGCQNSVCPKIPNSWNNQYFFCVYVCLDCCPMNH